MEPRKAKALVHGHWQNVLFHGLYQVKDVDYANVLAVVETRAGHLRKVDINLVELEIDKKQLNMFE